LREDVVAAKGDRAKKMATPLLLRALAGEPVDHPPIWLFRQAGRYLPEYRELRAQHSFGELVRDAKIACEATLQPIRRFPLDAAIVFSDLLVPLEGLGYQIHYGEHGPEVADAPTSAKEATKLARFDATESVEAPARTLELMKRALPASIARIGFAGAPWTLALYLLEGKGSKGFEKARARAFADETSFERLIAILAEAAAEYCRLQVNGGAQVIQLFDSWACLLSPTTWSRLVLPAARRLVAEIRRSGVPVVWFLRGSARHAHAALETGADGVSVDFAVDLESFARVASPEVAVQGNLDPALLLASPEVAALHARRIKHALAQRPRFVFNLGHGITPDARVESVAAVVEEVVHGPAARDESAEPSGAAT
jgi:uroporphyrinogen decarboxylase